MAVWIRLEASVWTHWKTLAAAEMLGIDPADVVKHLASLWTWAPTSTPDGELGEMSDFVIAKAARWPGDPAVFVSALVAAKYVDADDRGRRLHGWLERMRAWADRREEESAVAGQSDTRTAEQRETDRREQHRRDQANYRSRKRGGDVTRSSAAADGDVTRDGRGSGISTGGDVTSNGHGAHVVNGVARGVTSPVLMRDVTREGFIRTGPETTGPESTGDLTHPKSFPGGKDFARARPREREIPSDLVAALSGLPADLDAPGFHLAVESALSAIGFATEREVSVPDRGDGRPGRLDLVASRGDARIAIELDDRSPRAKSARKLAGVDAARMIVLRCPDGPLPTVEGVDLVIGAGGRGSSRGDPVRPSGYLAGPGGGAILAGQWLRWSELEPRPAWDDWVRAHGRDDLVGRPPPEALVAAVTSAEPTFAPRSGGADLVNDVTRDVIPNDGDSGGESDGE